MTDLMDLLMDENLSEAAVAAIVGELDETTLMALHAELEPECIHTATN